jgi:hypothetical protein
MTTTINTCWEATRRVMAAKFTRLTHKIAIRLHLVAESCNICNFRFRRQVRKLLDIPSLSVNDDIFCAILIFYANWGNHGLLGYSQVSPCKIWPHWFPLQIIVSPVFHIHLTTPSPLPTRAVGPTSQNLVLSWGLTSGWPLAYDRAGNVLLQVNWIRFVFESRTGECIGW